MKKWMSFTLSILLAMGLTACSKKARETNVVESEPVITERASEKESIHLETEATTVPELTEAEEVVTVPEETETLPESYAIIGVVADDGALFEDEEPVDTETDNGVEESIDQPSADPTMATQPLTEYEKYMNMSGEEQQKFFASFVTPDAFFEWLNAAEAEYESQVKEIVLGDGPIDLEEIFGDAS